MTCHGCGQPVIYDEATNLHHCGKCIRIGDRVEWCGDSHGQQARLTGTVSAYDLNRFDTDRVLVLWDTRPAGDGPYSEHRDCLRHINALDLMVESLDQL